MSLEGDVPHTETLTSENVFPETKCLGDHQDSSPKSDFIAIQDDNNRSGQQNLDINNTKNEFPLTKEEEYESEDIPRYTTTTEIILDLNVSSQGDSKNKKVDETKINQQDNSELESDKPGVMEISDAYVEMMKFNNTLPYDLINEKELDDNMSLEDIDNLEGDKQEEREISSTTLTSYSAVMSFSEPDNYQPEELNFILSASADPWCVASVDNVRSNERDDALRKSKDDKTRKNKKKRKNCSSKSVEHFIAAPDTSYTEVAVTEKDKRFDELVGRDESKESDRNFNFFCLNEVDQNTINDIDYKLKQLLTPEEYEGIQHNLTTTTGVKLDDITTDEEDYTKVKDRLAEIESELSRLRGLVDSELSYPYTNDDKLNDLLTRCILTPNATVDESDIMERKILNSSCTNSFQQAGDNDGRETQNFRLRQTDNNNPDGQPLESLSDDKIQEVLRNPRLTSKALSMAMFSGYAARKSEKFIGVNRTNF